MHDTSEEREEIEIHEDDYIVAVFRCEVSARGVVGGNTG